MKNLILVLAIISTTIWNIALAESARANDVLLTLPGHHNPIVTNSEHPKAAVPVTNKSSTSTRKRLKNTLNTPIINKKAHT